MLNLMLHASAYVERNLLQQQADIDKLKEVLVLNQEWVSYPAYTDRNGWDTFLGTFLAFERTGNRQVMENPFDNNRAIATLLMAELTEGKGRFTDQTWGEIDISRPEVVGIRINGVEARLTYDATRFTLSTETKELTDVRLSKVWGNTICRLSFTDRGQNEKGNYTFKLLY